MIVIMSEPIIGAVAGLFSRTLLHNSFE